jgi:fucose permease
MEKSRKVGVIICLGTVLVGLAFIWGIARQNYWAVAIPVLIGFLSVLALGFWIGWTMAVTEIEAPKPEITEEKASVEAKD